METYDYNKLAFKFGHDHIALKALAPRVGFHKQQMDIKKSLKRIPTY